MKHTLVTLAAIMALIAARGVYAADEHKGHEHMHDHGTAAETKAPAAYSCPIHKDVVLDKPGTCSKCKMKLESFKLKEPGRGAAK